MSSCVAVIDVGSNTIKSLVASLDEKGEIQVLNQNTEETRLGKHLANPNQREMSDQVIQAGCHSIEILLKECESFQPSAIRIIATSAIRDAKNGDQFAREVEHKTGIKVEVISGEEEARLIGKGIAADPAVPSQNRFLAIDLGGGSMEVLEYDGQKEKVNQACSLKVGAVRLKEMFITDSSAVLKDKEKEQIKEYGREQLNASGLEFGNDSIHLIGAGGAITITRAILAEKEGKTLEGFSRELTKNQCETLFEELASKTLEERLLIPELPSKRADILPVALLVLLETMRWCGKEKLIHSFYNLRYGVVSEMLK